jgi:hypothetical protein
MNADKTIQDVQRTMFTPGFLANPPEGWEVERKGNEDNNFEGTTVKLLVPPRTWTLTGERDKIGGGYEGVQ